MTRGLMPIALLAAFVASDAWVTQARTMEYAGICEASAGAFIDRMHFAVASDESNKLRIYERGKREPVASADMEAFTSFDKSDLEAAAAIGDRVYWMSSHSFNKSGEDKAKRKVFFATKIMPADGKPPTLVGVGRPVLSLRDPLAKAAGVEPRDMDIEALAATPDGGLLIGLRKPLLPDGRALVIPFKNPAAVVDQGVQPEFGAGPVADSAEEFALFRWSGPGTDPVKIDGLNLAGLKPEAAMAVPGHDLVQLLSDDDDICDEEKDPPHKVRFRSIDVKP
jgi:hypothetical protein